MCCFNLKKPNLHKPHIMKGYVAARKHFVWPPGWGSTGWRRPQRWGPWSRLSGRWPLTEPAAVLLHWPIPPGSACCSPSCLSDWEPFIQYKKKDRLIRGRAECLPSVTAFAGIGRRPTHMSASGATSVSDSRMSATMPMISVATGGSTRLTLTTSQSFFTTDSSSESSSSPVPVSWPSTSSWIKSTTSAALSGGTEQVGSTVGWNHSTYQESGLSLDHFETSIYEKAQTRRHLTGGDGDIVDVWEVYDLAFCHVGWSPAGLVSLNVQLATRGQVTRTKTLWIKQYFQSSTKNHKQLSVWVIFWSKKIKKNSLMMTWMSRITLFLDIRGDAQILEYLSEEYSTRCLVKATDKESGFAERGSTGKPST